MSFDSDDSLEVRDGVILMEDGPGIFSDLSSPFGSIAPVGSEMLQDNLIRWKKIGAGNNQWFPAFLLIPTLTFTNDLVLESNLFGMLRRPKIEAKLQIKSGSKLRIIC